MKYNLDLSPEESEAVLSILRPTGYRILVLVAKVDEKVGSLYIPQVRQEDEEVAAILGKVIALGPDAYSDRARFPNGHYCLKDDVVMMASYSGRRLKIGDREYRLINDDTVMAVVMKSEEIKRA